MKDAFIKLHISIILAGATGIFGKLISLNEALLVWYRMMLASLLFLLVLSVGKRLNRISFGDALRIGGVGLLLGLHWVFFYGSIKASNVSIGVVCFSLVGFFTAFLEPLVNCHRVSFKEVVFSLLTLFGVVLIFHFDTRYRLGIGLGSPDKSGGKFFNSIENLHLCTMNNQGLLALAQLILPSEILSNFEVVRVEEEASLIRIYLDESVKAEYKENPEIESKGFCEAVTIRDFPIRDKGVDLIVRRRKWYDKQNNRYFSDSYDLKAEETRYSKEFAAFLKGVYGDDSYDLPFA